MRRALPDPDEHPLQAESQPILVVRNLPQAPIPESGTLERVASQKNTRSGLADYPHGEIPVAELRRAQPTQDMRLWVDDIEVAVGHDDIGARDELLDGTPGRPRAEGSRRPRDMKGPRPWTWPIPCSRSRPAPCWRATRRETCPHRRRARTSYRPWSRRPAQSTLREGSLVTARSRLPAAGSGPGCSKAPRLKPAD